MLLGCGHIGSYLKRRFGVDDDFCYMADLESFADFIGGKARDVFINTAGKTDLSWCEANPAEAFRCNVIAPLKAFRAFKSWAGNYAKYSLWVHLSSGCVWDGPFPPIGLGFTPQEPPTPACFYSWTKAACDAMLLREAAGTNLCILRPRQVYSELPSPRNTLTKLRSYKKLINTQNSMTSAETIALTIERLARYPAFCEGGRIINCYDTGVITPFKVGQMLATSGLRSQPQPMEKEDLDKKLIPRRVDVVLEDPFFEDLVAPPPVEKEMARVIRAYASREVRS